MNKLVYQMFVSMITKYDAGCQGYSYKWDTVTVVNFIF